MYLILGDLQFCTFRCDLPLGLFGDRVVDYLDIHDSYSIL